MAALEVARRTRFLDMALSRTLSKKGTKVKIIKGL